MYHLLEHMCLFKVSNILATSYLSVLINIMSLIELVN